MEFLTFPAFRSGTEKHLRVGGGRSEFFSFDYDLSHDASVEDVCVQIGVVEEWGMGEFGVEERAMSEYWPEIKAGVRTGFDANRSRGIRLCCTSLFITSIRETLVDTTAQIVRDRLTEFIGSKIIAWAEPIPPLHKDWLTSDVIALARGIHATSAFGGLPALHDALLEAGCDDPLVMEHLRTCPDHSPSCWVVEMILAGSTARASG